MHHYNTILSQMLKMFSRYEFQKAVFETKAKYHARGFSSWNHFVAMLFGQLSGQDSLRGIEAGLATQGANLYHSGIKPIHRSTLAYANKHRSQELFKKTFFWMLSKCEAIAPKHKFRTGKIHETQVAPSMPLERGDVAIFDRGYTNLKWYKTLDDKGVYFVTRMKRNAYYQIVVRNDTSSHKNIYSDQIIQLKGFYSKQKFPNRLRRIRSRDPETGKIIVILTNNLVWSAATIAQIYKERWQIELFFKYIKQQLKVKSFVGTSKNALLSQLWAALITYLLLSYLKFKSKFAWPLYTFCSILPTNLFSRRNPWDWLNAPFHEKSEAPPEILQLKFSFC